MNELITAKAFFHTLREQLDLQWVAGEAGGGRAVEISRMVESKQELITRLNCIQPGCFQVLGADELRYLDGLGKNSRADLLKQLFDAVPVAVFIADQQDVPEDLIQRANYTGSPLFRSSVSSRKLINITKEFFSGVFAEKSILHGVFMEVKGIGVLLSGPSGIGKSELALELLSRGHRLIADDAPEFTRVGPNMINGRCPNVLQDFLEVRGLGVLNVRSLFGDSAIKPDKNLRLIVNLRKMTDLELMRMDRLQGTIHNRVILDVEIPEVDLPVAPGRNLAVLVESAVSNHILRSKGYDPAQEFIKRQQAYLLKNSR